MRAKTHLVICLTIFSIAMFFTGNSVLLGQETKSQRVLFLGNSVFYFHGGLYQSFEGFAKADGLDYQAVSQRKAPANIHDVEFLEYGRIPLTLPDIAADNKIHSLIRSGNFDYVIIEARRVGYLLPEWIELPKEGNYGKHIPYVQNLAGIGKIHKTIVESGAKTVLYMHPGAHELPNVKHAVAQIYQRLQTDLEQMEVNGKRHKVMLVPASKLWLDALKKYGTDNWYADHIHGKPLARYASGCLLYTYITGKDPRQNDFRELPRDWTNSPDQSPAYLSEEDSKWIKDQVWLYYSTRP